MTMMIVRPVRATDDARTRFLDAAEQLFCEYGYEGTKIRAIAKLANVNLGLLSQYWGSKKELFRAVFDRRLAQVRDEELGRLRQLNVRMESGERIELIDVLRAKIEPTFIAPGIDPDEAGQRRLLMGRARIDPSPEVVEIMSEFFSEVGKSFFSLLRKVSGALGATEFYWRANCVAGAFSFIEAYCDRLTMFIDEDVDDVDWVEVSDHVAAFLAAGMQARPKVLQPRSADAIGSGRSSRASKTGPRRALEGSPVRQPRVIKA